MMEEAQAFEYHKRSLEQQQLSQRVLPVSGFPGDGFRVPDGPLRFLFRIMFKHPSLLLLSY